MAARARLVLIHPPTGQDPVALRSRSFRLGRSEDCDLVIPSAEISRHHARIIRTGTGHHEIEDLGSVQGTEVNGEPLRGPRPLAVGDEISLAGGTARLRYELEEAAATRGVSRPVGVAAALFVLAAALGAWWLLRPGGDPAFERAQVIVDRALEARKTADWRTVHRELRSAAGLLYQARRGELGERDSPLAESLQALGAAREVDLWKLYQEADRARASRPTDRSPSAKRERCRMDEAGVDRIPRCLRLEVDAVLEGLGEDDTIVPDAGLPAIGAQLARRREFFAAILEKDNPALAMVLEELDAEGMPRLFHYLALVESAYRPDAVSHAGAAGVWQFIPATARRYRLEVSTRVDERRDPRLATRAAVAYLRDLRARFVDFEGALLLAIASYNYGERRVEHALRRLDDAFGASPYWELVERDLLPRETQEYVPRFFAAAVAGEAGLPSEGVMRAAGY